MSDSTVLVAGAGPTGLTLACTLLRWGVPCRVVDRRDGPGSAPKALVLWSGALEALRRTGVSDAVVAEALALQGATYWSRGRQVGRVRFGGLTGTAFPAPLCLPQPRVESLLQERLTELGGSVDWGVELVDATAGDSEVAVALRHADGAAERLRVPWLVGADGTRSRVRDALGIRYEGRTYDRSFLLGDGILAGDAPADEAAYHLTPDGVLVLVPLPGGGHRVFFDVAPDDEEAPPSAQQLQRLLDARGPGNLRIERTWWTSRFRVHAKVAERFRAGRAFLAGDAAHGHSPAGGQGLNTGVQDGYDLGWKLASVARGGDGRLLDSYEAERRPAAVRAVRAADRQTRLWLLRSAAAVAARDAGIRRLSARGVLERRIVPQLAQLDLDHRRSPAVADLPGAGAAPRRVRAGRRIPDAPVRAVQGTSATTLHAYLARGRHTLAVVGGAGEPAELAERAAAAVERAGASDVVDVLEVRPPAAAPAERPDADGTHAGGTHAVVVDTAGALCTGTPWLAHIRPDGVVAARAGAASLASLLRRMPSRAAVPAPR